MKYPIYPYHFVIFSSILFFPSHSLSSLSVSSPPPVRLLRSSLLSPASGCAASSRRRRPPQAPPHLGLRPRLLLLPAVASASAAGPSSFCCWRPPQRRRLSVSPAPTTPAAGGLRQHRPLPASSHATGDGLHRCRMHPPPPLRDPPPLPPLGLAWRSSAQRDRGGKAGRRSRSRGRSRRSHVFCGSGTPKLL